MPLFQKVEGGKAHYWRIELKGAAFYTQTGTGSGPGKVGVHEYASEAAARRAGERLIAKRLAEGWIETEDSDRPPTTERKLQPRECAERLEDALRGEKVRVADLLAAWERNCTGEVLCRRSTYFASLGRGLAPALEEDDDELTGTVLLLERRFETLRGGSEVLSLRASFDFELDDGGEVDVPDYSLAEFLRGVKSLPGFEALERRTPARVGVDFFTRD